MPLSTRGQEIIERLRKAKTDFGDCYPKYFGGAAAVEILRAELSEEGILTSGRDVFVKGFSSEIDLLVPKKNAAPWLELLYEAREVAVALEVKKIGSFGVKGRDKIKNDFARLHDLDVKCAYVTFEDRENYCWRPTEKFLGFPCYALAWHKNTDGPLVPTKDTEDWDALVSFLRKAIADR